MSQRPRFVDREDAGRRLAQRLLAYRHANPIVVGLPRGGVVVAAEVARALGAPLDVVIARKVASPRHPEFGVGAVAPHDVLLLQDENVRRAFDSEEELARSIEQSRHEMDRRLQAYRGGRAPLDVVNRVVIAVDDGIATGVTARAAVQSLRRAGAQRVILAVPLAPNDTVNAMRGDVDELVILDAPDPFGAVGLWYESFEATTDDEVVRLLSAPMGKREVGGDSPAAAA